MQLHARRVAEATVQYSKLLLAFTSLPTPSLLRPKDRVYGYHKYPFNAHPKNNRPQDHRHHHGRDKSASHLKSITDLHLCYPSDLLVEMPRPLPLRCAVLILAVILWADSITRLDVSGRTSSAPARIMRILIWFWVEPT